MGNGDSGDTPALGSFILGVTPIASTTSFKRRLVVSFSGPTTQNT